MKGTFDGLTEKQREQIREISEKAIKEFDKALKESGKTMEQILCFMKNNVKLIE